MSEAAAAAAGPRFWAGATALASVLGARKAAFRPLLGADADPGGFAPAGAGAGGPVGDMLSRLREALAVANDPADVEPEATEVEPVEAVEEAIARARAEAFAAGEAEGRRAAEAAFGMRIATLDRLLAALDEEQRIDSAALEAALADVALDLVRRVLGAEPVLARETIAARVAEAAVRLGERVRTAMLRLNPDDFAALDAHAAWPEGLTLRADESVAPGGFALGAGDSLIEDCVADRLDRVATEAGAVA